MSLTLLPSRPESAFTIAVTSGKGGVGKTSVSINLAAALARLGRRVTVVDADFALGNVDVRLGLAPNAHIGDVLDAHKSLDEVTVSSPLGFDVVPAASGVRELSTLSPAQWARFGAALSALAAQRDFVIVDTASGIGDTVIDVVGLCDYALVVTSPDQASLVDAYAMVKLLVADEADKPIGVLVNSARDSAQASQVFRQIASASERFLGRTVRNEGYVVADPSLMRTTSAGRAHRGLDLVTPASSCFARLALRLAAWRPPFTPGPGPALALPGIGRCLVTAVPSFAEASRCA